MKLNLNKLIKKEIIITSSVVLFLTLIFIGFTRAIYIATTEGETNTITYGDLEIQICDDTSCANIASNLGKVVGMTDNVSFSTNMYPKTEAEGILETPYSFVVKNVGDHDAYVALVSKYDWAFENPGSSLVTNYNGVMVACKKNQDVNYQIKELNQFTVATKLCGDTFIASGESQVFHMLVWAGEEVSNEIIGKKLISKVQVNGYYLPEDLDGLHNGSDNLLIDEETDHVNFTYTGDFQEFIAPYAGTYKIELWGAQGGNSTSKGAYTRGLIELSEKERIYIYVGEGLHLTGNTMAFNNGTGSSDGLNGGGATDVRLVAGKWDDPYSLNSRIMVAAGSGSGSGNNTVLLGAAGGLTGYSGGATQGGTQTNFGSTTYIASQFGIANGGCTGGNGYYPGGGAACIDGAGGGSSYISGHAGCIAINDKNDINNPRTIKNTCTATSTSIACSTHYSGKTFTATKMIDGAGYKWTTVKCEQEAMPNPSGGFYALGTGHAGNGYAKITYMPNLVEHTVTFNLDGGTQSFNFTGSYYEGEEYYIEIPSKPNYIFNGWTISNNSTSIANNIMTVGNANTTITANWKNAYSITYNLNDGNQVDNPTSYYSDTPEFTLNNPTKSGYTFVGWTGSNGATPQLTVTIPQGSSGNKTYIANWLKIINNFDFVSPNGGEQTYTVTRTGLYKLEVWGAQGGSYNATSYGGYGGYTKGEIELSEGDILYVNVGGRGYSGNLIAISGGYNGGGSAGASSADSSTNSSGGGATHIALSSGLLSGLYDNIEDILLVAGGGGGVHYHSNAHSIGGYGGGYKGSGAINQYQAKSGCTAPTGGTQSLGGSNYNINSESGSFGQGGRHFGTFGGGGGGGYYGGASGGNGDSCAYSGAGGSGYIGNSNLTNKYMYAYCESNCTSYESSATDTKTYTTPYVSDVATSDTAKSGNGYARITYLGS